MKTPMKNLMTAALIICGSVLASESGLAQTGTFVANDLYLGFQNQANGGSSDYIINLGPAASIVGGSTVVDLSASFSLSKFSSTLGSGSSMYGGVVGGYNNATGPSDVYLTQLRSGVGIPSVAGSTVTATVTKSGINGAVSTLNQIIAPVAGAGVNDTTLSWENYIEPANTGSTFIGNSAYNPDAPVSPGAVLYEDLWYAAKNGSLPPPASYTYLGYFTLDLTGGSPKLTFTPMNAPGSLTSPVIASVSKAGSTVTVVSSNAVPTHTYQLQYTTSLNPTNWNSVGSSQVAGATTVTNTDATATDPQRFYRVQAQ